MDHPEGQTKRVMFCLVLTGGGGLSFMALRSVRTLRSAPFALRPGNVHSADGWEEVLKAVMARYAGRHLMRFFRGDAAFAIPNLSKVLEVEDAFYAIRLRTNTVL